MDCLFVHLPLLSLDLVEFSIPLFYKIGPTGLFLEHLTCGQPLPQRGQSLWKMIPMSIAWGEGVGYEEKK